MRAYVHELGPCCKLAELICNAGLQECHCMLFLTEDNGFRGEERKIDLDMIKETTKGMSGVQD